MISTLEILFGGAVKDALTPVAAASLLVFSLLYTPCIAAIASIRRELGRKWAVGMVNLAVYDRLGGSICGKVADGFIYEIMKIEQKVLEGIGKIE